jgi:diguanylate cyclase (GGDEF)-like protein/PAS domain S-box-containing protein
MPEQDRPPREAPGAAQDAPEHDAQGPDATEEGDERGQALAFAVLDALTERVACYRVRDLRIVYCNRSWAAGHGHTPAQITGARLSDLLTEGELEGLHAQLDRLGRETPLLADPEFRPAPEGSGRWVEWVDRWLPGPDGGLVVAVGRDVTELRHAQAELAALALRDPLTGLANRRLLDELFELASARGPRSGEEVVILFVDVDGLKQVNDTHGHDAGDRLLRAIASRLDEAFREADVVARIGGDEFVVLLETDDLDEQRFRDRVERALSTPVGITAAAAALPSVSIGVAHSAEAGWDMDALLEAADAAMYEQKRARDVGRSTVRPADGDGSRPS